MNVRELLMVGLLGWTALGAFGMSVSLMRGDRAKAVKGLTWVAVVWVARRVDGCSGRSLRASARDPPRD